MNEDVLELLQELFTKHIYPGVYLASPTGNLLEEEDKTFIEIEFRGNIVYAKPSMPFGTYFVPSTEWLEKHKESIGIWVAFEHGDPSYPVWMGVAPLDDKHPESENYPKIAVRKTTEFTETFDDEAKSYALTDDEENGFRLEQKLLSLLKGKQKLLIEEELTTLGKVDEDKIEAVRSTELIENLIAIMEMVLDMQTISPVGNNSTGRQDPASMQTFEKIKKDLEKIKSKSVKLD